MIAKQSMIRPFPYIVHVLNIFFSKLTWTIPNRDNFIFLTFDDGPCPEVTPWVLDVLAQADIKATFFCIGQNVEQHRDIYLEIINRGHSVGNHTQHHISGWSTEDEDYVQDVEKASTVIHSNLFRPPYGRIGWGQYKTLHTKYKIIMWDVLSKDYDLSFDGAQCIKNVIDHTKSGSIIVMHDSKKAEKNLKESLPKIIQKLKEKGFVFQTIPNDENI